MELSESTIPVIDISTASGETARQVLAAASTHGFLFIKNDGIIISSRDIDDMFAVVRPPQSSCTDIWKLIVLVSRVLQHS